MRIVQIGPFPLNPSVIHGGVESSVYGLAMELSNTSSVFVIDLPRIGIDDSTIQHNDVTVFRFNNPGYHQKDMNKRVQDILSTIQSIRPTICHVHGTGVISLAISKGLRLLDIPYIVTVHGLLSVEKKKALHKHFTIKTLYQLFVQSHAEKRLLSSIDKVIVDTMYVKEAIKNYNLAKNPEIYIIPQGIDSRFFGLNCSSSSRVILSVGSISRRKGHLQLIQAFNLIADELADIKLVICGVLADLDYYHELTVFISSLSCKDRITIKTNVEKTDLLDLYNKSHVFSLHSQEESQGIVFAEAMAAGLPIVATNVGGIPYVVDDQVTGLLSGYGDINSFSLSIKQMMNIEFPWDNFSQACRKKAQEYSWKGIADRIKSIYLNIIQAEAKE